MITYTYPLYEDHMIQNGGHLPLDKRAHALWHYYLLCQKLLETAGSSIEEQNHRIYEGEEWMDKPYANIAKGVAIRYGLKDPGEFLKSQFKRVVEQEVQRMEFPEPADEYWNIEPGKVVTV